MNQADVNRAEKAARKDAVDYAFAIMFTVLRDKFDFDLDQLIRLWRCVNDLSDSISKGYVKVQDLLRTLDDEAGIVLADR